MTLPDRQAPGRVRWTAALLAANAALAGVVWLALNTPIEISPIAYSQAASAGSADAARRDATSPLDRRPPPDMDKLAETLARPLFRPDRRPPPPRVAEVATTANVAADPPAIDAVAEVPAEATPPPPLPEGLRLVGVARLTPRRSRALLRTKAAVAGTWMSAGEMVAGWRIAEIGSDEVWLEAAGQRHLLSLPRGKPAVDSDTP